ncbi:MAG: DNA repair protein RecO [Paracoccaceae bacterium]
MDWRDEGLLLASRPHGESAAIIDVLTLAHGRYRGVVHGGQSRKLGPTLQPGTQLALEWRARLEDHLGTYRVEPVRARAGAIMADRLALAAFNSMAALIVDLVPEREADADLHGVTIECAEALATRPEGWIGVYVAWEIRFLSILGFGLDLSRCAVTGARHDLAFVSPRTGRAVSREAGRPWANRLLPLAPFLVGEGPANLAGLRTALAMTGHFLAERVCPAMERDGLPETRHRLVERLDRLDGGLAEAQAPRLADMLG